MAWHVLKHVRASVGVRSVAALCSHDGQLYRVPLDFHSTPAVVFLACDAAEGYGLLLHCHLPPLFDVAVEVRSPYANESRLAAEPDGADVAHDE